jgi:hypothetical protein
MESSMHLSLVKTLLVGAVALLAIIAANAADHNSGAVSNCYAMGDSSEPTFCE